MNLLESRLFYKPFEYHQAYEYWLQQQTSFWIHTEISTDQDIYDWRFNLTDSERNIIGNILKSFVQSEILIGDYWRSVAQVFPKSEIAMMATAFSNMETVHQAAYAYLQDSLGLDDFEGFMQDPIVKERLTQLSYPLTYKKCLIADYDVIFRKQAALSLAIFSAFGEGVLLFSAFIILMSFAQRGLMRGLGEIIEMSIRDESLHAKAGCWLFNEFMKENKDIKGIKKDIYEACNLALEIEDKFINSVFMAEYQLPINRGDICFNKLPNLNPNDLKQFIRNRANKQLKEINMKPQFKIDKEIIKRFNWFDFASNGNQHADFFSSRVTQYAKTAGWGEMFKGVTE